MKYELLALDVWGNSNDGYDINQQFRTGLFMDVEEDDTKEQVIRKAKRCAGIKAQCQYVCSLDDDHMICFDLKRNGKPALYFIRYSPED